MNELQNDIINSQILNILNKKQVKEEVEETSSNVDEIIEENEHLKFFNKFLLIMFFGVSVFSLFRG